MEISKRRFGWLARAYSRTATQYLVALVIFVFFSWLYMGPALTNCNGSIGAFNSDTTGGLVWFQWAGGNDLDWGHTTKSNYPIGENLNRPQAITAEAFSAPYRVASALTSPVCGVNIMVFLGYLTAALTMFGFIRWLTGRTAIALFAGYAAAYLPFHQLKAQSHVIYSIGTLFIAMIWAYFWYLRRPSFKRLIPLGLTAGIAMYMDGYFILFAAVLAVLLIVGGLLPATATIGFKKGVLSAGFSFRNLWANCKKQGRGLILLAILMIVILLPIAITQLRSGHEIKQSLALSRGNIQIEARSYGARIVEYFLPAHNNALLPDSYERWRLVHQHNSNPSETTVFLGLTVIALAAVSTGLLFYKRERRRPLIAGLTYGQVAGITLFALIGCLLLSLQSKFTFMGKTFLLPVGVLIEFTSNWRVFSRFVLVVSPLCATLAALALNRLTLKASLKKQLLIVGACFTVLFLEFLPSPIHSAGNFRTQTPQIYHQIGGDAAVDTIAEYPLNDLFYVPTVFTFQPIHGKNVINANDSAIVRGDLQLSLAGLADRQTLGVLKQRSVDVITSFGIDYGVVRNLAAYRPVDESGLKIGLPRLYSYKIDDAVEALPVALVRGQGFDFPWLDQQFRAHHQVASRGELAIVSSTTGQAPELRSYSASFQISPLTTPTAQVEIRQGEKVFWSGEIGDRQAVTLAVEPQSKIEIKTSAPVDITDLHAQPR